jgi:antitoxin component of RelBE/YafQ-DinJ toxin-antitoxin module
LRHLGTLEQAVYQDNQRLLILFRQWPQKLTPAVLMCTMTTQTTPQRRTTMSTIHFRIDEETKRLATQAAERQKVSLTELMRQRAEELAEEEREYQSNAHEYWLEQQIEEAFASYEAGEDEFISNEEMHARMDKLKQRAMQGKL